MKFKIKKVIPVLWDLERDGVSQSFLMEFLSCRQKAHYAYREGWSSVGTSNAITFGSLFHGCLESIYRHLRAGKEANSPEYITNIITSELTKFKEDTEKERIWTLEDTENHMINEGYLRIILPKYVNRWYNTDKESKWLLVEDEFNQLINIDDFSIRMRGKFDRVARNKNKEIWVYETKTKSIIDPSIQDRLSFDPQVMIYTFNYETQYKAMPTGFVYDMIKRPGLRKGSQETMQKFMERVKKAVDEDYLFRIRMPIDLKQYTFWKEKELKPMLQEFTAWAKGTLPTYRNPASCDTRYGTCRMVRLCGMKDSSGLYQRKILFPELNDDRKMEKN